RKTAIRGKAFREALRYVAGIIDQVTNTSVSESDGGADLLYKACCIVGAPLGLTFRPHPDSRSGRIIADPLRGILAASKIRKRSVQLRGRWWQEDCGPLLAFTKTDMKPVALIPEDHRSYWIVDPETEEREKVTPEIAEGIHVNATTFYRPF